MATASVIHLATSREMMANALEAVARNDLLQASENGWGAFAHLVKGLSEQRGWGRYGDRQLYQAVNRLAQELGGQEIRILFNTASALQSNFDEPWMPQEMVSDNLAQIKQFLDKLSGLA